MEALENLSGREAVWWLRAFAALAGDLGFVPSTHTTFHNPCNSCSRESMGLHAHNTYIHRHSKERNLTFNSLNRLSSQGCPQNIRIRFVVVFGVSQHIERRPLFKNEPSHGLSPCSRLFSGGCQLLARFACDVHILTTWPMG